MFFNRKRQDIEPAENEHEYGLISNEVQHEYMDSNVYEEEKKRAFYGVLHGKPFTQIQEDLLSDFSRRSSQQTSLSNQKIQSLEHQITALRIEIKDRKEQLNNTSKIEDRYEKEIEEIQIRITELNEQFQNLVGKLGTAHANMIPDRIQAAKKELEDLRAAYQEVFKHKYENEADYLKSLVRRRELIDELIEDGKKKLKVVQAKLSKFLLFGNSELSASFLYAVGMMSAIGAGWFFSVFSSSNNFDGQTWLFFGLSNMFNYLFLYVEQFGPLNAFKGMMLNFIILLSLVTAVFWIVQYAIEQLTNDETNVELGFNFTQKSRRFLRLRIKTKSLLSFWLHVLPWIFILGIVTIVLTIGQYFGSEQDQINELGKRLSGQLVGTTITLMSTAIFFLFASRVIERIAPSDSGNSLSVDTDLKKDRYRKNKELTVLVGSINIFIIAVIVNQVIGSNLPLTQLIFSILCFVLLLNLTAFTLSYGIRQRGLLKTNKELESKLKYLTNLRTSISGSTPVNLWIREGNQFREGFLALQKDILDLSRQKNQLLNPYKRFKKVLGIWSKDDEFHSMSAERFGEMTKSPNREKQFFLRNFPEISYKIADVRNKLNEAKRDMDVTKTRLVELRDGHSDFQNNLNDEIRSRKGQITMLQNNIFEIRQNNFQFTNNLEKLRKRLELELMEGAELGDWTKEILMKTLTNKQMEQS